MKWRISGSQSAVDDQREGAAQPYIHIVVAISRVQVANGKRTSGDDEGWSGKKDFWTMQNWKMQVITTNDSHWLTQCSGSLVRFNQTKWWCLLEECTLYSIYFIHIGYIIHLMMNTLCCCYIVSYTDTHGTHIHIPILTMTRKKAAKKARWWESKKKKGKNSGRKEAARKQQQRRQWQKCEG